MPKLKTKRAAAKRFKKTGTGKLKRKCANMSHLAPIKSQKQKRHLRMPNTMSNSDAKRVRILIQK